MPTNPQYSRGSEWRKWDLHIHSPRTKKNDGFSAPNADIWDEYCRRLEDSDVQVFGITDYFSADGYINTKREYRKRYPHSSKTLFLNIELCTNDVVNARSEEVNLHILFNPAVPPETIEQFLSSLKTGITGPSARNVTAAELKTQAQFETATTTREFITEALKLTFGPNADLTNHVLKITAVNSDGIRPKGGAKRKAAISDELDKFSNGFFGNSNNTAYYLDTNRLGGGVTTEAKPVVSGCDAHSLNDIDEWLGKVQLREGKPFKQSTWIKANPTFEGLRQIIFDPAERVFIGEEPAVESRVRVNQRRYLKTLFINQVEEYKGRFGSWFKNERIDLNKELIAIIGNKGGGKSAITDILGLLGNSHNQRYEREGKSEVLFSFLNKEKFLKLNCASNFFGEVHWYAGEPDTARLDSVVDTSLPEALEYIPQKYLEKICANIDDDEFRHKLDEVIFGYVKRDDRYDTNSLEELIAYLSAHATEEIEAETILLHKHNENVVSIERKLTSEYKNEIESRIALKEAEVAAHASSEVRPAVVEKPAEADAKIGVEIEALGEDIKKIELKIAACEDEKAPVSKLAEDLNQARQAIERQVEALKALERKYQLLFDNAGIKFSEIIQISADYSSLDSVVQSKRKRFDELLTLLRTETEINNLGLSPEDTVVEVNVSLVCQADKLNAKRKELVDRLDKPNRDYQNYLRQLADWEAKHVQLVGSEENPAYDTLNWLKQEQSKIATEYPALIRVHHAEREQTSRSIFKKKNNLVRFYTAIKQSLDREIDTYKGELHGYAISVEASMRLDSTFHDEFFSYINQAVKGSFHGGEDGKSLLKKLVEQVDAWGDESEVFQFLVTLVDYLRNDRRPSLSDREDLSRDLFKQVREKRNAVEFYDFLFGFSYLKTKYDLKVDNKDLSELSPGERGGLLLVFYLMLDKRDIPLVIDQPEDNLDNKSVYEILVTFLKKAKKRRQIIIATHNPNLAVVADAEQIIHVSINKTGQGALKNDFSFNSGAIEDPIINKLVVDILEGTLPAFDNRRLKYRRQPSYN